MHSSIAFILLTLIAGSVAKPGLLSYNEYFDLQQGDLSTVSCSDGSHGLITQGYKTFASLPSWPYIGGAPDVEGWNSKNCGSCWELKYTNPATGNTRAVHMTAIDRGVGKFVGSKVMMDQLVGGNAVQFGTVQVEYKQVLPVYCGF